MQSNLVSMLYENVSFVVTARVWRINFTFLLVKINMCPHHTPVHQCMVLVIFLCGLVCDFLPFLVVAPDLMVNSVMVNSLFGLWFPILFGCCTWPEMVNSLEVVNSLFGLWVPTILVVGPDLMVNSLEMVKLTWGSYIKIIQGKVLLTPYKQAN